MPNVRTQPTPAIPQPRGVEDAAPYGRVRDVGISITVSRCVNAANLRPPLGSPERGAVTALCAVTEGLVQRGCGVPTSSVNPRRAGVEARPYGEWGGGVAHRTDAIRRPTAAHRGRCALRCVGKYQRKTHVIRPPTEGASRTPPPTVVAKGKFQRSRKVQFDGTRYVPCRNVRFAVARRVHRPRCTVVARLPGQRWRGWPACPTAPTLPTVRPPRVYHPTYPIPRAQPAHHFYGRTHVIRPPTPGGRGSHPLRRSGKASASHPRCPPPLSSPFRGAEGWVRRGVAAYNLSSYRVSKHAKRTGLRTGPF